MFDVRVDKSFTLGRGVRMRGLFDLFNITNSNAVETRTITTGTSFLRPTAVLSPRTARLGVRLTGSLRRRARAGEAVSGHLPLRLQLALAPIPI